MPRSRPPLMDNHYAEVQYQGGLHRARLRPDPKTGYYLVDLRGYDQGRLICKTPEEPAPTKDVATARRIATRMLRAVVAHKTVVRPPRVTYLPPVRDSLRTLGEKYARTRLQYGIARPDTAARQLRAILQLATFVEQHHRVSRWMDVTRDMLRAYMQHLAQVPLDGTDAPASVCSRLNHAGYLSGFFTYLVVEGVCARNPLALLEDVLALRRDIQANPSPAPRTLTAAEVQQMLERSSALAAAGQLDRRLHPAFPTILATVAYTGARKEEILGLEGRDVCLRGGAYGYGTIEIRPNAHRPIKNGKTTERTLDIVPSLGILLRAYVGDAPRAPYGLFFSRRPDALYIPSMRREALWSGLNKAMAKMLVVIGLPADYTTPHGLRHTYITYRLRTSVRKVVEGREVWVQLSSHAVAAEAGHSAKMTEEVYNATRGMKPLCVTIFDFAEMAAQEAAEATANAALAPAIRLLA